MLIRLICRQREQGVGGSILIYHLAVKFSKISHSPKEILTKDAIMFRNSEKTSKFILIQVDLALNKLN